MARTYHLSNKGQLKGPPRELNSSTNEQQEPPSTAGIAAPAIGNSPPSAYTLSPAALERLRQSQEQQALVDGADQYRLVGNGSNLPARDLQRAELQPAQLGVDEFEVAARDQQHAEKQGIVGFPDAKSTNNITQSTILALLSKIELVTTLALPSFVAPQSSPSLLATVPKNSQTLLVTGAQPEVPSSRLYPWPAAIERLCRASEKQSNILAGQLRSPQDKAKLPMNSPLEVSPGKIQQRWLQTSQSKSPIQWGNS
ncbi:hypothetical protein PCASD_25757 [Puccinia coronata f. sp. avenae]|uniref:Uncharacterized protein n=1 Tax=Puccinia coronata f. sp. avenae TaxID=200324 RepID=A0A2N5RXM2_9BASI|nr:hypothetical protein PCASD_25757 [Puccinia coronata f. sp. avenae]